MNHFSQQPQSIIQKQKAQPSAGLFSSIQQKHPINLLRHIKNEILDWVYPPRCSHCQRVDSYWCASCLDELETVPFGSVIRDLSPLHFVAATSPHEGILRDAAHALKYEHAYQVAMPLASRWLPFLEKLPDQEAVIVPIPLHQKRLQSRGYNQAEVLASALSIQSDLPLNTQLITRERYTESQVGKTHDERVSNVKGAFQVSPTLKIPEHVILIDDVMTTGSTLCACAETCLMAGVKTVSALTITSA